MVTDAMVVLGARALFDQYAEPEHGETFDSLSDGWQANYRGVARAVLEAVEAASVGEQG